MEVIVIKLNDNAKINLTRILEILLRLWLANMRINAQPNHLHSTSHIQLELLYFQWD